MFGLGTGIRRKLLLSYVAIAIPLIFVILITQYNYYRDKQNDIVSSRAGFALSIASNVEHMIKELSAFEKSLGYTIFDNNYTRREASSYLTKAATSYPVTSIDYVRVTGEIYASSDASLVGTHLSRGDYDVAEYTVKMTRGKDMVISPLHSHDYGIVGFDIITGIWKKKGLAGVVVMSVDASRLNEIMPLVTVRGDYNITDNTGMLVYQSQHPVMPLSKRDWSDQPFVKQALGDQNYLSSELMFPVDYSTRMGAQVPIHNIGWTVGSFIPANEAMAPIMSNVTRTGLIALLIIVLAIMIGLWVVAGIVRPVALLTQKAKDLASGNLNEEISGIESDEQLKEIAQSFDTMRVGLKEYVDELYGLVGAGEKMNSALDLESVNIAVVDSLKDCFDATAVWISLYSDLKKQLVVKHAWGSEGLNLEGNMISPGEGVTGKVIMTAKPSIVDDVESSEFIYKDILLEAGVGTAIVLPLISGGGPIGTVGLCTPFLGEGRISKKEMNLLMAIANQAAVAIENAHLYEESIKSKKLFKDSNDDLRIINKVATEIASGLSFNMLLGRVERNTLELVDADFASISLCSDQAGEVEFHKYTFAGDGSDKATKNGLKDKVAKLPGDLGFTELLLKVKRVTYTNDYKHDAQADKAAVKLGVKAVMVVPMMASNRLVGFLQIGRFDEREFSDHDVMLCEAICSQVALAIENEMLREKERIVSETLQNMMLKAPDKLHGVKVGNIYRSATDKSVAGGDFYDFIEFKDGRIGMIIGDVSSKGLEAAANTALAKMTVRAYAYDYDSPADVLNYANSVISTLLVPGSSISMVYLVINPSTGEFTYSSAGHPMPMIADYATFKTRQLETGSAPLGAGDDSDYEMFSGKLDLGEALLLYTDGLLEARSGDEMLGEERIAEAMLSVNDPDVKIIPQRLLEMAEDFTEGRFNDDLAVVVLIREGGYSTGESGLSVLDSNSSSVSDLKAGDGVIMDLISELEAGIDMSMDAVILNPTDLTGTSGDGSDGHGFVDPELEDLSITELIEMGLIETDIMDSACNSNDMFIDQSDDLLAETAVSIKTINPDPINAPSSVDEDLAMLAYEALASLGNPDSTSEETASNLSEGGKVVGLSVVPPIKKPKSKKTNGKPKKVPKKESVGKNADSNSDTIVTKSKSKTDKPKSSANSKKTQNKAG